MFSVFSVSKFKIYVLDISIHFATNVHLSVVAVDLLKTSE